MDAKIIRFEKPEAPIRKRRKYNDGGILYGIALALLLLYLGGYLYTFFTREKVPETVVVYGSIEPVMVFNGVIVRDETVYRSAAEGLPVYYKNDLDKVPAGAVACSIQDEEAVKKLMADITSLEKNILSAQEERAQSQAVGSQIKELTDRIRRTADNAALSINALNTQALYEAAIQTEQLLNHRNQILINESRGSVKSMSQGLSIYLSQMEGVVSEMPIGRSGIISYRTDGYEEQLTPSRIKVLSPEETMIDADLDAIYAESYVQAGDPVFKIINSNDWYIASYLPAAQTEGWQMNDLRNIYVDDGSGSFKQLETRIDSIDSIGEIRYVVFHIDKRVTDYLDRRGVSFKIKEGLGEGLKIPNSAIIEKTLVKIPKECAVETDEGRHVLRYNMGTGIYDKMGIVPFASDNVYYSVIWYADGIRPGDILAIPARLGETYTADQTEIISGVYVTNTGAAVFKRIYTSGGAFENISYTIVDPADNPNVKVKDRIVSDASTVEDRQMIY
ncbi:MAG: hypothetical protein LBS19_06820 [Clostridiales bacterium]|jgi:hypothetical protein|nr:hypothetical protein [Clostridiales bacterium]